MSIELCDSFLHAEQSKSSLRTRSDIESGSVVLHHYYHLVSLRLQRHEHTIRVSMARAVRQRFLHDSVDTGALGVSQFLQIPGYLDTGRNSRVAREFSSLPL